MSAAQLTGGSVSIGTILYGRDGGSNRNTERLKSNSVSKFVSVSDSKSLGRVGLVRGCDLTLKQRRDSLRPLIIRRRNIRLCAASSEIGGGAVSSSELEERTGTGSLELGETGNGRSDSRPDVKKEILMLSLPAVAGQALDPLAQLLETAYIGRLGALELGSAGVSVNVFNYISKLFNIPLLSVATSFVAEDISKNEAGLCGSEDSNGKPLVGAAKRMQLPSVSTALLLAVGIGVFEALALSLGSGLFLSLMGISIDSPMRVPAQHFLSLRALGAPAVVVSLALQGVFRGFKDTKTPVLCLGVGNLLAVFLFPVLMYSFGLGVTGAALSTVISQYVVTILMLWFLNKRAILLPPKMESLQFGGYAKSGGFLLGRTLAVLSTMTLGTSMAAREGPVAMAAHQICIQVWLAVSLLIDAMGAAAQALTASYLSKGDYKSVKEIAYYSIKLSLFTGILLTVILSLSFGSLATLFTKDPGVLKIVGTGVLFVSASQPLNALAYVFDGLHYGVSDFAYVAWAMMVVGAISSVVLVYGSKTMGLPGVWLGLTIFMGLRAVAGFYRLLSRNGPWWFLHSDYRKVELAN